MTNANFSGSQVIWLGVDDLEEKGNFMWHSGRSASQGGHYSNWATGSAPLASTSKGCVVMAGVMDNMWTDLDCTTISCCSGMTVDTICQVY